MIATPHDFTLSASHINPAPVMFAEYFDQPSANLPPNVISGARNDHVSHVYMFSETLFGTVKTYSSTRIGLGASSDALEVQMLVEKAKLSSVWKSKVLDPNASSDVDALSETIDSVYELVSRWGPEAIEFQSLNGSLNGEHLAAVLRITADFRGQISGWDTMLGRAVESLRLAGLDYNDALTGLI